MPLLIASKMKEEHNREGWCPPRHVEMATTRQGGACRIKKETRTRQGGPVPSPSC